MIWNDTHENIIVVAALLLVLTLAMCSGKEAMAATVTPQGLLELTDSEKEHCNKGGGCKLINEHQITILIRYIEQLKHEIELLIYEQEAKKLKECI